MSALRQKTREHYERLKACRDWRQFAEEGWKRGSCPLCLHYIGIDAEGSCDGCPVRRATGYECCIDTPWQAMSNAISNQSRSAMPLISPLPEVAEMADFLERLDWEGQP